MEETILRCERIVKSFALRSGGRIIVLNETSFQVLKAEVVTVTGRSGVGKTTLVSVLSGIERVDSGTIELFGTRIEKATESVLTQLRGEKIGIIFQNHNLIPSWTAVENVEAALVNKNLSYQVMRKKALELLESMNLLKQAFQIPAELSAGQQQRVAVARALINKPPLIIADEPFADVDPQTASEISMLLLQSVQEWNASIIMATHSAPPEGFTTRVFTLANGHLLASTALP
ncbi:MAG: ATP-binding cassette domain-containing protein [Chitinivibrionales bacterium]|nr:ATP-binding cassette domain-containing protein [Chitinivibrionales bacterium]